ncbi:PPE family protein [Mycobacterium sp. HUMS_1102779]
MGLDFAALPPEVNSGRMYAGAGAGPLMAAAAAWDGLAAELSSAAASYRGVVTELTDNLWLGTSSESMTAAAAPYVTWMNATATRATQTALQVRSAAAAYEAAYTATVPPPLIAANRASLASLVATNILGQNTPAIAATEAQYGEMWAQDAAAMYGYAGASAAATTLTAFTPAPPNTNPAGAAAQHAATSQTAATSTTNAAQTVLASVPGALNQLSAGALPGGVNNALDTFQTLFDDVSGFFALAPGALFSATGTLFTVFPEVATAEGSLVASLSAAKAAAVPPGLDAGLGTLVGSSDSAAGAVGPAGLGRAGVSAGMGESTLVGGLSVPPAWGTAAPAVRLAAMGFPMGSPTTALDAAAAPPGTFCGMPAPGGPIGSVVNTPRRAEALPQRMRSKALPSWTTEPGAHGYTRSRAPQQAPPRTAQKTVSALNGRDHGEVEQLRSQLAAVTKKRDLLRRAAVLMIKQSQKQR